MTTYKMFSVSLDVYFYFQNIKIQEGVILKSCKIILKINFFIQCFKNNTIL